ncbi:uncharacterized protein LOC116619256 [Nematostella vectensis]|uniref:uncharacterized protein LOC116619256 n=1 Tax=Nematostella vectensis TaxID=45351 RepID=UPI00138FDF7E|nr:uncharacterized protein LOC116619256 [Nematostella vectensis]
MGQAILAILSRELFAAEGHYHTTCRRDYTRPSKPGDVIDETTEDKHSAIESKAYEKLFDYIRSHILETPSIVRFTDITEKFVSLMKEPGAQEVRESTKRNHRRKLENEYQSLLQFEDLLDNKRLFVIPETLSRVQLAKEFVKLSERQELASKDGSAEVISRVALDLRHTIRSTESSMVWPQNQSDLSLESIQIPENVKAFLFMLLTGQTDPTASSQRVDHLVNSFGQDLLYGTTCGRIKTPKHILLPYAVKSLTNNIELIQILNRCGHGISYSQIEELNTALCLQKLAATPENMISNPGQVPPWHGITSTA